MRAIDNEHGVALLAVLGIILSLLPLAAAVSLQTQLDGLMERNFRGSTEAFYAAEAGLAHALSEIGPHANLGDILHGVDELDTAPDNDAFPFRSQPPAAFVQPTLGYEVSVNLGPANTILVHSRGHGRDDAVREVEALVGPTDMPFTPAALFIEAADVALDLGGHGFQLSGLPEQQQATQPPPIAGLAVSSSAAAIHLQQTLTPAAQVDGAGDSPSVAVNAALDLDSYGAGLRNRLDAAILPAAPNTSNAIFGTEAAPQLTVIDSNWTIDGQVDGFGILVVRGDLEITGSLQYRGLVLCGGKLTSAESSDVRIDGTLWMHSQAAAQAELLGTGYIRYNPAALDHIDSTIVLSLLHLPVVVGWREVS